MSVVIAIFEICTFLPIAIAGPVRIIVPTRESPGVTIVRVELNLDDGTCYN